MCSPGIAQTGAFRGPRRLTGLTVELDDLLECRGGTVSGRRREHLLAERRLRLRDCSLPNSLLVRVQLDTHLLSNPGLSAEQPRGVFVRLRHRQRGQAERPAADYESVTELAGYPDGLARSRPT